LAGQRRPISETVGDLALSTMSPLVSGRSAVMQEDASMIVAPNADGRRERSGSSLSLSIVERCKDFRDPIRKDPQL
jgi:hypothetical protein